MDVFQASRTLILYWTDNSIKVTPFEHFRAKSGSSIGPMDIVNPVLYIHNPITPTLDQTPPSLPPIQGTTLTPQLLACATTLFANPSNPNPASLSSLFLIRAIS